MLVSTEGTTFCFATKTSLPLCKFLGNKLQECIAASSMQALIQLIPILLNIPILSQYLPKGKYCFRLYVHSISSKKNHEIKRFSKTKKN